MINFKVILIISIIVCYIKTVAMYDAFGAIAMGAISAGFSIGNSNVKQISEDGPNRNVVIEISNYLKVPLTGGTTFIQWGSAKYPAPTMLAPETREIAVFYKTGDTATGTAGALSYRIGNETDVAYFALIWSVPYNYIHSNNWFGLRFIEKHSKINWTIFSEAWYDETWATLEILDDRCYRYAYDNKAAVIFHNDYVVSATMSDYGRSIIKIAVQKVSAKDKRKYFQ